MSKEIIRARDMASALELAEKRLGSDVLIVKSSDHGGHVEIEVEKKMYKAIIEPKPLHDAENKAIKE